LLISRECDTYYKRDLKNNFIALMHCVFHIPSDF
jgi:hypothetical protein